MRSIVGVACLCACALAAQQPSQKTTAGKEPPPGTLHSIVVKGNKRYSAADIILASGLKIGQHVTGKLFEEAQKNVSGTQLFNNVSDQFRYSGNPPAYDLTITVIENDQVFAMRFERLDIAPDTIRRYLQAHVAFYADRIPATESVIQRYTSAVQEFISQSHPSLRVKARVMNDDPSDLTIMFAPDEPLPTISQVLVSGNQAIDTGTLLRAINGVAVGVPMTDARTKLILDGTIRPLYAAKGFMAVTFPKVESERSKTNLGYILKVTIQEGPTFKFGVIKFHGNGLDQDEVRSAIPFKPGQTFNGDQVETFRRDLVHRMQRRGYLDIKIEAETQVDESKRAVEVAYNVAPGSVYTFSSLDIKGLDLNSEPVIQKLWGEKPGSPFNPDYPEFFLKRVQEQSLFDNLSDTRSEYTPDTSTHGVVVHLYFKSGKPKKDEKKKDTPDDSTQGVPPV